MPRTHSRRHATRQPDVAQNMRVINRSSGPPIQPELDQATASLVAEQAGFVDATGKAYDEFSFNHGIAQTYVEELEAELAGWLARSRRAALDDLEVAEEFTPEVDKAVAQADAALEVAAAAQVTADVNRDAARRVLSGEDSERAMWAAPDRLNESARARTMKHAAAFLGAGVVEMPFNYYALQILGESMVGTLAMAAISGGAGLALAHLLGVTLRKNRGTQRRVAGWAIAALMACCLLVMGTFLALLRVSYLARPVVDANGTQLPSALKQFHLSYGFVFAGWLAIGIAIWAAVAAISYHLHNPFVAAYQVAKREAERRDSLLAAAKAKVAEVGAIRDNATKRIANVPLKWTAYRSELEALADRRTHIYRRALLLGTGNPNFTTAVEVNADSNKRRPNPGPSPDLRVVKGDEPGEEGKAAP